MEGMAKEEGLKKPCLYLMGRGIILSNSQEYSYYGELFPIFKEVDFKTFNEKHKELQQESSNETI